MEHTDGMGVAGRGMPHHHKAVVATSDNEQNGQIWQVLDMCWREKAGRSVGDASLPHLIVAPAPHLVAAGQGQCVIVSCAHLHNRTAA